MKVVNIKRTINAVFWLYIWLSHALMPVTNGGDYGQEKLKQLLTFGPFDDPLPLLGRAIFPGILCAFIDLRIRKPASEGNP